MVIDYSERRQSQRIQQQPRRPTRPSVWPYALVIIVLVFAAFLLGIGTGWYLFHPGGRFSKMPPQTQPPTSKQTPPAPTQPVPAAAPAPQPQTPTQPLNALPAADKPAPAPLTFYNTLQKGNKELMGTGINQPKEGQGGAPKPVTPAQPER